MLQEETRTQMMATAQRLADALRATPGVDAWQVATTRRDEAQVYLIGAEIEEARRVVASEDSSVTLHNLHTPHAEESTEAQQGTALGATTLTILSDEAADSSRLAARLRDGALMASLTDNQPFTLPAAPARGFPVVEAEDHTLGASLEAAVERAGQQL
ncbi:MAG TPA: hypothetical protein VID72_07510, partial [Ktedonobacterales bacterium]